MARRLKIEYRAVESIIPYENNTKEHNQIQIDNITQSIIENDFTQPILIDKNNVIIAGHGRLLGAINANKKEVPVIVADWFTEEQVKKYRILDNKLNESDWLDKILKQELEDLDFSNYELDFGLEIDFELDEQEIIEDEAPDVKEVEHRTKLGDIWQLGRHRLMCGDSTDEQTVLNLMNGNKADMVFTDPPYNVDYEGKTKDALKIENDHFETDEECGEKLWLPAFKNMRNVANDCCSLYCCMPQGSTHMMMMMMMKAGWQVKHEIIWKKQSIVLNRADYNYQHEPIAFGWNKKHKFYGNGQYHTTSVWEYDRPTKSKEHPTMKPIALICEALENSSVKNDVVIDIFGGSGSTLIACEQLNRICYMMELDPKYCDVIINRWETLTGEKAIKI